jgi:radical SAM protein with 4Fe4S-binding SPASM domain
MRAKTLLDAEGANLHFACTVTQLNKAHLQGLVDMLGGRLSFQPIYALGDEKLKKIGVSGEEYLDILAKLKNVELSSSVRQNMIGMRGSGCSRCAVGEGEISVASTGEVYPCHMLHFEKLICGNVFDSGFKDIYYNSPLLRKIRRMSVDTKKGCSTCGIRYFCGGGCWARSYLESGNLEEEDGFCNYTQIVFTDAFFADQGADAKPENPEAAERFPSNC